jgi:tetratricopeptide (TPR) repeat protein
MKRHVPLALMVAAALAALAALAPSAPRRGDRGKPEPQVSLLTAAQEAFTAGRSSEARALLARLADAKLPPEKADAAAYLRARLEEDGESYDKALLGYLSRYPHGVFRRETTLALAKLRYVSGDYGEAENLLSIFSPGVERGATGREALVTRGLSQLGRGDAPGALQFLLTAEGDLKGSLEEEAYYYAVAEAAIRSSKPAVAMTALRALLERHPQGDYAPQALYAMGTSLEMVGRQADASSVFRQVAQRFPLSYEATRARDRGIRPGTEVAPLLPIGGGYAIQIGAFTRRDLADGLARELRQTGVEDVSVRQGSETPAVFRVRAGSFAARDQARALGERLRRERGFSYQVVPR